MFVVDNARPHARPGVGARARAVFLPLFFPREVEREGARTFTLYLEDFFGGGTPF